MVASASGTQASAQGRGDSTKEDCLATKMDPLNARPMVRSQRVQTGSTHASRCHLCTMASALRIDTEDKLVAAALGIFPSWSYDGRFEKESAPFICGEIRPNPCTVPSHISNRTLQPHILPHWSCFVVDSTSVNAMPVDLWHEFCMTGAKSSCY
ncbi:hypothetical protein BDU57DRAFT_283731 [Ampelomyces quisqualis]|uniref:Uncharacterized protein n=1 Tax=Ampelomyces quisqualis TaxID=50730 RepID=A0A6A5QHH5_AMPQU|nr:hypothetical protein BDU57DRAFT_283731 [Ampelomyces quisqualis]